MKYQFVILLVLIVYCCNGEKKSDKSINIKNIDDIRHNIIGYCALYSEGKPKKITKPYRMRKRQILGRIADGKKYAVKANDAYFGERYTKLKALSKSIYLSIDCCDKVFPAIRFPNTWTKDLDHIAFVASAKQTKDGECVSVASTLAS